MIVIDNTPIEVNYYLVEQYDGNIILNFTIPPFHPNYSLVKEEATVLCEGKEFTIKSIDEQDEASVECSLNFDSLKGVVYTSFTTDSLMLEETLEEALDGTGWTVIDADMVTARRSLVLQDVTPIAVVEACRKAYGIVYRYDTVNKTITVIKPENIQPKDVYLTDQLNLRRVDYKGDTYEFCTRLYPYGADGLDISGVNDGKTYIDNFQYSDKVIAKVWRDERYTDPQNLKDAAIEMLKILSQPNRYYELDVIDLAKLTDKYSILDFSLYDIVTLIDRNRGTKMQHRVVEYERHPHAPEQNKITLSTVPQKIEGLVTSTIAKVEDLNSEMQLTVQKYNELKRDLDTNVLRVGEAYTIGETDYQIESKITQSKNEILTAVSEQYATLEQTTELETNINNIEARFSQTGGKNVIKDSCGIYGLNAWTKTGTVYTQDTNDTTAKKCIVLAPGTIEQTNINIVPNASYLLCFKYKTSGTGLSTYEYAVNNETDIELEATETWSQVVRNLVFSQGASIKFASTDGELIISDLLLIQGSGDLPVVWEQAEGESHNGIVKISENGIDISRSTSEFKGLYTHEGVYYTNKTTNEDIANFTKDGAKFSKAEISGETTIGKLRFVPNDTGVFLVIDD